MLGLLSLESPSEPWSPKYLGSRFLDWGYGDDWSLKHLLHEHEDLSSAPWHPCKSQSWSVSPMLGAGQRGDPRGFLTSQSSATGELQAQ